MNIEPNQYGTWSATAVVAIVPDHVYEEHGTLYRIYMYKRIQIPPVTLVPRTFGESYIPTYVRTHVRGKLNINT